MYWWWSVKPMRNGSKQLAVDVTVTSHRALQVSFIDYYRTLKSRNASVLHPTVPTTRWYLLLLLLLLCGLFNNIQNLHSKIENCRVQIQMCARQFKVLSKTNNSGTGTRTLGSCVKGKYVNHLHHTGT